MKYAEYKINNNTVSIHNSIIGVESICVNGKKVSNGFSFFGRDHFFKIGEDRYTIRPYLTLKNFTGIAFAAYKNGLPVTFENKLSKKEKRNLVLRNLVGIGLGMFVGLNLDLGLEIIFNIIRNIIN